MALHNAHAQIAHMHMHEMSQAQAHMHKHMEFTSCFPSTDCHMYMH